MVSSSLKFRDSGPGLALKSQCLKVPKDSWPQNRVEPLEAEALRSKV